MNNVREQTRTFPGEQPGLPPFPEGWYFVADRAAILKQKLIGKTWMGIKIVAWSDTQGRVCVAEAVCPHLGSQLGPEVGGQVRDGCLVCPFHGFEYAASGQCVATPNAPPPPTARLKTYHTREICGMVFAWWGHDGQAPRWYLPAAPASDPRWSGLHFFRLRFPGHPQETSENAVDLAHLRYVHGYDKVCQTVPTEIDGACLKTGFDFRTIRNIAGIRSMYDISALIRLYGLGYSYIEAEVKNIGIQSRLWVLVTPMDDSLVELTLASQTLEFRNPKRFIAGLRFIPNRWRHRLMNRLTLWMQQGDVLQDVAIWSKKQYRPRPRLARSDGEVAAYRRYCRQFYPRQPAPDESSSDETRSIS